MLLGLVACAAGAVAAPTADRVTSIPGFKFPATFDVFSGYLHVPGPIPSTDNPNSRGGASGCSTQPYDSLSIHYQLNMAQGGGATKPVVAWHQGGPGGSSTQGGMIEMSYFQVDDKGTHTNPFSWNHAANMLYLESPAGSGGQAGFSTCLRAGKVVDCCWDDRTQGIAYAHTLLAFLKSFPELGQQDFYLAGESYFGQYGPNIAAAILDPAIQAFKAIKLKGLLVGNGCWVSSAISPLFVCL